MGVMQRFFDILRATANKVLDRVEDPRDTLDLSYEKQVENLQTLRRSVAEVATARKRVEMQMARIGQQADLLQGQARQALTQGREDLAREALSRRVAVSEQLTELQAQQAQIADQEETLTRTAARLQAQVATFRTRKETLKASYTAAEAQARIGEAAAGISGAMSDAGATIERAQDRIADMQARAGALDELLASGALSDFTSGRDDIQAQLDALSASGQVDAELAALKSELAAGPAPGLPPAAPTAIPASGPVAEGPPAPPPHGANETTTGTSSATTSAATDQSEVTI